MERLLIWRGLDEWRAEAGHVRIDDDRLTATGTQLGVTPEPYRRLLAAHGPAVRHGSARSLGAA